MSDLKSAITAIPLKTPHPYPQPWHYKPIMPCHYKQIVF